MVLVVVTVLVKHPICFSYLPPFSHSRVLQATAELFGLFGHQTDRKSALVLICDLATRINDSEFLRLAAGDLLKMGDGHLAVENLEKMLKSSKTKQTHLESFHVPVGVAYAMFYREVHQVVHYLLLMSKQKFNHITG